MIFRRRKIRLEVEYSTVRLVAQDDIDGQPTSASTAGNRGTSNDPPRKQFPELKPARPNPRDAAADETTAHRLPSPQEPNQ
jgi:hypothetical protein